MTFEEWKQLPYVKATYCQFDDRLLLIFNTLSEEEKLCMKNDKRYKEK